MTEVDVDSANQEGSDGTGGAGTLLRQAREQQQLSLQAVAAALKVPAYKLQALEEDRWDALANSVFTRSLALSVCRFLRIPTEPVLARLPKHEVTKLAANPEGINTPFKEKTLRSLMSSSQESDSGSAVKVIAAVLIMVAGGAGLYFLPQWEPSPDTDTKTVVIDGAEEEPLFMPAPLAEPVQPEAGVAPVEAAATEPVAATESAAATEQVAPTIAPATPVMQPALPEVVSEPAQPAVTQPSAVDANAAMLRFVVTRDSWVQVRDAQGRVVVEKFLKAGEDYQKSIAGRPLQVVIGNAAATTMEVDGATLDLAAFARSNVARIEVK